jgi:hypothetical protein
MRGAFVVKVNSLMPVVRVLDNTHNKKKIVKDMVDENVMKGGK